jgi:para-nitrobenzyl esterase
MHWDIIHVILQRLIAVLTAFLVGSVAYANDPQPPPAASSDNNPATARIASGQVSGTTLGQQGDVQVYKGIPYAAPPVGDLRWKPPQPVRAWDGTRSCTQFGHSSLQHKVPFISRDITDLNEDCLYLNVWAPARRSGRPCPVMVWIHGGSFVVGSSCQSCFNSESLARQGVVVVTINYRLGPMGFFAHPLLSKESANGVSGNYGLLDQIAALQWVQKNISAFGGDPNCVTIFGESAGAVSVCYLLVSPLSAGLFHRAIAESGGSSMPIRHLRQKWYGKESMESVGTHIAGTLGCDQKEDPLAALRAKPAGEILQAAKLAKARFGDDCTAPVVDGWVLPDDPGLLFEKGKTYDLPFITGTNENELPGLFSKASVRGYYGHYADTILKLFPDKEEKNASTVAIFTSVARADARAMSGGKSKAYLYRFTRLAPPTRFLGVFHSEEIFYVFGNLDPKYKFESTDLDLSRAMMSYWVQFARTGDPNAKGLPVWPAYDAQTDINMELGDTVHPEKNLFKSACDGIDPCRLDRINKRAGP